MEKEIFFLEYEFTVKEEVFCPRPETEELAIICFEEAEKISNVVIIEIGTGAGCIAISLSKMFEKENKSDFLIIGTDISLKSIRNASLNSERNKAKNVFFVVSDLLSAIANKNKVDIIVSNPPYIPKYILPKLKITDPLISVNGGEKGYEITERIIHQSKMFLKPCGLLFLEIGFKDIEYFGHTNESILYRKRIMDNLDRSFHNIEIFKDLNGIERYIKCRYGKHLQGC